MTNSTRDRISNIGAGMVPTYHATESVEEAKAVVEQCRSATDELRRMLDERGVEYYASPNGVAWGKLATPIHGRMYTHYAVEIDGLLCVDSHCITPEQAIAATLGMGVNCSKAEHDAGGCLGFQSGDDDEPVDQCKACHKYTSYEVEL